MKIIDLTMMIDEQTPVFPGDLKQEIKQVAAIEKDGWNEKRISFSSHFSTHIDAPFHMLKEGKKLTDYPLDRFIGDGVVIDARNNSELGVDYVKQNNPELSLYKIKENKSKSSFNEVKLNNLKSSLDNNRQNNLKLSLDNVRQNDIVFFYTGRTKKAGSEEFFKKNPTISKGLAQRLIDKKIKIVGLDSFTPDNAPFEIHKLFFKHDILIVENLVNLEKLIGKRFKCYILPLKIKDADGAPCRVIGVIDE
ncbi:cyclase family protein [Candidatus Woesearchaeota archaeon]|nr:cyclase family protein [Candidatus Woesearchaeota archaeon]